MKTESILAWHFLSDTGLMRDGRKPHKVETHDGPLALCESGLHASIELIDALRYAPGAILCRVRCSGEIVHGDDKLVCRKRTILWRVDATKALRQFARWCASQACLSAAKACEHAGLDAHPTALRKAARGSLATMEQAAQDAAWAAARDARGRKLVAMVRKFRRERANA